MADRTIELSLLPITVDDADEVESIRLLVLAGAPHLVTSATAAMGGTSTRFASTPLHGGGTTSELAVTRQLLRVPPQWDVRSDEGGGPVLLYEIAGGATNALYLARISSGGPSARLTGHHRTASFGRPRFVRGARAVGDLPFTAVADSARVVSFSGTPGAAYAARVAAEDGVLVHWDRGHVLIYKETRWGPVRGESAFRGVLRCVRLRDDLQPAGPALAPFGDATVFELDADVRDGALVVLATTLAGLSLAWLRDEGGALEVAATLDAPQKVELIRPSILAVGAELHVAALDLEPKDAGRVWAGRVELRGPP